MSAVVWMLFSRSCTRGPGQSGAEDRWGGMEGTYVDDGFRSVGDTASSQRDQTVCFLGPHIFYNRDQTIPRRVRRDT